MTCNGFLRSHSRNVRKQQFAAVHRDGDSTNSGLSNTAQNKLQYKLICTNTVQYTPIIIIRAQYVVNRFVCIEYRLYVFNTYHLYSIWNPSNILSNPNWSFSKTDPSKLQY